MHGEHHGLDLLPVIALLAAAVIAAPLFKRLKLGSVLGYLVAGIAIGPYGLRILTEPASLLQVAELGVVMFLFVIGLEMRPSRLWGLWREIFGLGLVQVVGCAALLTAIGVGTGYPVAPSFVSGIGFVLTSTAIVMQLLEERRELGSPGGLRIVSILLLEDLMIVPLLVLVAFLAPIAPGHPARAEGIDWAALATGVASIAGLIVAGRYLLNPMFALLARTQAREVMTAGALLVVLGAGYAMELGGLSMAMGAFLAGVLLSESVFRYQLESDVEPFRALLLGLFFLAVGMSLDLGVVAASWRLILFYVLAFMAAKGFVIFWVARLFRSSNREAIERAVLMAQGGEFAFVLYAAATSAGILTGEQNAVLTAIIILSMLLTPLAIATLNWIRDRIGISTLGHERPEEIRESALVIGFGRVGQIAGQVLLARGYAISMIDTDVEMVDVARRHDFRVYYGDGTRLDILRAAGAGSARVVLVCVEIPEVGTRIVELLKAEFPQVPVVARASDRRQSLDLIRAGADVQIRETFESAIMIGEKALEILGVERAEIAEISARVRDRDDARLQIELASGFDAGSALFSGNPEATGSG